MKISEQDVLLMRASRILNNSQIPPGTQWHRLLEKWRSDYADYLERKQQEIHQLDLWNNGPHA